MSGDGGQKSVPREVLEQIDRALNDDKTLMTALGYTKKLMVLLANAGLPCDGARVDDLVYEAIGKTVDGTLTWDPTKVAFGTHVCGAVKSRVFKELRRAEGFRDVALDETRGDFAEAFAVVISPESRIGIAEQLERVKAYLFEICERRDDEPVRRLLGAYLEGTVGRSELSQQTGMSVDEVTNARKRLDRMIADLPEELRVFSGRGGEGKR